MERHLTTKKVWEHLAENCQLARVVQGARLKIECVRTRGFEPHSWQTLFSYSNFKAKHTLKKAEKLE